jgi:hypothetical protein
MLFFGVTGSNNDINVLIQSPLFIDVIRGHTPKCPSLLMVVSIEGPEKATRGG